MKNLYKKLSVVVLSGALLIGGPLSSGLMAYANSDEVSIEIGNDSEEYVFGNEIRVGQFQYEYEIVYFGSKFIYNRNEFDKRFNIQEKNKISFGSGMEFRWYLSDYGIEKGLYRVEVGDFYALLYFSNKVLPGIDWSNYDNVQGGYLGYSEWKLEYSEWKQ